jgi:hypothetical protein
LEEKIKSKKERKIKSGKRERSSDGREKDQVREERHR